MSKTIKQIADELGVSKQAVVKRIDNLGLRSKLVKNGNLYLVDDTTEKLIKSGTLKQIESTPSSSQLVSTLQAQVDTLKQQLDVKDNQIAALQSELDRERQHARELSDKLVEQSDKFATLADHAQQLEARSNEQTRLLIEDSQNPPKRHWWNRRKG